jgi:hypothetical protein
MWPIQLAFRLLISCRIFLCSLALSYTSFLTWSVQLIFSILLQHGYVRVTETVDRVSSCTLKVHLRSVFRNASVHSTIRWALSTQPDTLGISVTSFVIKPVEMHVVRKGRSCFTNNSKISIDFVKVRVLPLLFVDVWKMQGGVETAFA